MKLTVSVSLAREDHEPKDLWANSNTITLMGMPKDTDIGPLIATIIIMLKKDAIVKVSKEVDRSLEEVKDMVFSKNKTKKI